ncbi:MAG: DUF3365 domain-containing protein [Cyclobacteriaceae bacterium]|nr:DUF3365 domain-containing protein [Cyclobacteriaceae bacterium]
MTTMILLGACQQQEQTQTVSSQQLDTWVLAQGNQVAADAQKTLSGQLKASMSDGGPQQAIRFCNTAARTITDSLSRGHEVSIKRTGLKLRNPQNSPTQIEQAVLEEFQQALNDSTALESKVIHLDHEILFVKPILINNPLCLTCHGAKGTQIGEETVQLLDRLYPNDAAYAFQMGDLRGMWSITFDKQEIEQYLNSTKK